MDKQVLGGKLVYNAEALRAVHVGTRKAIEDKYFFFVQVFRNAIPQCIEFLARNRLINATPVDVIVNAGSVNDKLMLCGTTGVLACFYKKRSRLAQLAFAPFERALNQLRNTEIAINRFRLGYAKLFDAECFHENNVLSRNTVVK